MGEMQKSTFSFAKKYGIIGVVYRKSSIWRNSVMKMRVMYYSKKGKLVTYATAIGEALNCLVNDIPPAYPADKERLVVLALTLGNTDPADEVRRFCKELYPNRAQNVVLLVDGEQNTRGEKVVKDILKEAGTNVIEQSYYVKCGIFGKKITLEERQKVVDWARSIVSQVEGT